MFKTLICSLGMAAAILSCHAANKILINFGTATVADWHRISPVSISNPPPSRDIINTTVTDTSGKTHALKITGGGNLFAQGTTTAVWGSGAFHGITGTALDEMAHTLGTDPIGSNIWDTRVGNGGANDNILTIKELSPDKIYTFYIIAGTTNGSCGISLASGNVLADTRFYYDVTGSGKKDYTIMPTTTATLTVTTNNTMIAKFVNVRPDASGTVTINLTGGDKSTINALAAVEYDIAEDVPPLPEPKSVSVVLNKCLDSIPEHVTLPVPASAWVPGKKMTLELWVKPSTATQTVDIIRMGSASLSLNAGVPAIKNAAGQILLSSQKGALDANTWHHIAFYSSDSGAKIFVNGAQVSSILGNNILTFLSTAWKGIEISKDFQGKRDEIRLWSEILNLDDLIREGPLSMGHPKYASLVGCWKLDGNFRDCKWTEFAPQTGSPYTQAYQTPTPGGTVFSNATDNATFRYPLVSAYVRSSHIMYDWTSRAHLLNNSDLIYIGGLGCTASGDITSYSDNDVTESKGVTLAANDSGRTNVLVFEGGDCFMNVGTGLLENGALTNFTLEAAMMPTGENQQATLFENSNISWQLNGNGGTYSTTIQVGATIWAATLTDMNKEEWVNLAFVKSGNTGTFYIGQKAIPTTMSTSPEPLETDPEAVLGKAFQGKIDEMRVWSEARAASLLGTPIRTNWNDRNIMAHWGDSDVFGRDTASWIEHIRILRKMTANTGGIRIRVSIANGDSKIWGAMNANATARQNFAKNIAALVKKYELDGVDLDFEYIDTNLWPNYGLTCQAISQAAPDMVFSISPHTTTYQLATDKMQYVDYCTFQNYGPDISAALYSTMTTAYASYKRQGFPDSKILLSGAFYGTTGKGGTTVGYRDLVNTYPSVRANPAQDTVATPQGTSYYNGVTTTIKKTKFIYDNNVAGFMYWDLGLDVADKNGRCNYFDEASLLRAANRYCASTSYPITLPPFALDATGCILPAAVAFTDIRVLSESGKGWVATSAPAWLSLSADSGMGQTSPITLTAQANKKSTGRTGTIIFTSMDGQTTFIDVFQAGAKPGYDTWVNDHGMTEGTPGTGMLDSYAGDNITNLMKYATGLDPLKPCGNVTSLALKEDENGQQHLALSWPVNPDAVDVTHEVESSADLQTWTSEGTIDVTGKTRVEYVDPAPITKDAPTRKFLRLKVSRNVVP